MKLTPISETPTTVTLGWTPPADVGGYVFYAKGEPVSVATRNNKDGSPRNTVKFSKTNPGPPFEVVAVTYPPAVEFDMYPDTAPTPGTPLDSFDDFNSWSDTASAQYGPRIFARRWKQPSPVAGSGLQYRDEDRAGAQPWPDGSGIFLIDTPHGKGFRFVQNEGVSRGSGSGIKIFDRDGMLPIANQLGRTLDMGGYTMFPAAGNPNEWSNYADWHNLFEWSDGSTGVFRRLGVNGYNNTFYGIRLDPANPSNPNGFKYTGPVIQFDRWYKWRWRVKFAKDNSGSWDWWIDDQLIGSFTGQTVRSDEGGQFLEFGVYGGYEVWKNETRHGGLWYVLS